MQKLVQQTQDNFTIQDKDKKIDGTEMQEKRFSNKQIPFTTGQKTGGARSTIKYASNTSGLPAIKATRNGKVSSLTGPGTQVRSIEKNIGIKNISSKVGLKKKDTMDKKTSLSNQ